MTARLLLSYWFFSGKRERDVDLDAFIGDRDVDVFADSGGFTASTMGVDIDVRDYARWLDRWKHRITVAATLDVVGDAEATHRNTMQLRDLGAQVIPAFHVEEPWDYLDEYVHTEPYVALGGMVPHNANRRLLAWVARCFRMKQGARCGFHAFGLTSRDALAMFPWYSADASSWTSGFRYGGLRVFDPGRHRWVARSKFTPPGHADKTNARAVMRAKLYEPEVHDALVALGMHPHRLVDDLLAPWAEHSRLHAEIAVRSHLAIEDWLRARWGEQFAGDDGGGIRVYLAVADSYYGVRLAEAGAKIDDERRSKARG